MPQFNLRRPLRAVQITGTAAVSGNLSIGSSVDPFTWYTALDKSLVPFAISEPAAPVITNEVTVTTPAQFATYVYTPGYRINCVGNFDTNMAFTDDDVSDLDIVVPVGSRVRGLVLGNQGGGFSANRVRIRGSTVGQHSGGQVHQLQVAGPGTSGDIIIDGVDVSGVATGSFGAFALGGGASLQRAAIVNCRLAAGGFGIGSTASDLTVAGCSIITGLDTAAETDPSDEEAYGIRCYFETNNNIVLYANDIRSNPSRVVSAHARFRAHPDAGIGRIWINSNRMVERVENHLIWVDAESGGGSGSATDTYVEDNEFITGSTGTAPSASTPKLQGGSQAAAYIRRNAFKSEDFVNTASITMSGTSTTVKSDNTFEALPGSDPSWGTALASGIVPGAGSPMSIDWDL